MGYLIGAIIVIAIIYFLVVYVIAPIASVLGMIALSIGVLYAFGISISSFASSLRLHINPYTTYVDKNPKAVTGTRRSYFLGQGIIKFQSQLRMHSQTKAIILQR